MRNYKLILSLLLFLITIVENNVNAEKVIYTDTLDFKTLKDNPNKDILLKAFPLEDAKKIHKKDTLDFHLFLINLPDTLKSDFKFFRGEPDSFIPTSDPKIFTAVFSKNAPIVQHIENAEKDTLEVPIKCTKGSLKIDMNAIIICDSLTKLKSDDQPSGNTTEKKSNDTDYLKKIKSSFPGFEDNEIYQTGTRYHIFLDESLKVIDKTKLPECNKPGSRYTVHIYYKAAEKDSFDAEVVFSQNNNLNRIVGQGHLEIMSEAQGEKDIVIKSIDKGSDTKFTGSVSMQIKLMDKESSIADTVLNILSCTGTYTVSIMAGYNYSSLNNPENVTIKALSGGDSTLIADNEKGQRALTIMAVFYPTPRSTDYKYSDLTFFQKWSVCFGTKLSQNLFEDLFLGLNYEFAKIGAFAGGVHYGSHKVVAGYDNFKFGKDKFSGPFDTRSSLTTQWNFGLFVGVNIDLRILEALTFGAKRANALSNNENKSND